MVLRVKTATAFSAS